MVRPLKDNINPYVDEEYYISRTDILDAERFRKAIYKKNGFRCRVCNETLLGEEKIHLHHIIQKKMVVFIL